MKDTDTECVDDATCKNVAAEGSAEDLKCSCNQGFYKMTPSGGGNPTCEAGTCAFFAAACFEHLASFLFCFALLCKNTSNNSLYL